MHKTLYIDIDEEITSIIDRVKKAEAGEIIIVAPKNAMLLQSIVNLRLLKKETDLRKKKLLIITQDKIGKKLIEKVGIAAKAKVGKDIFLDADPAEDSYEPMYAEEALQIKEELQKEEQEKEIGSSDYFDEIARQNSGVIENDLVNTAKTKPVRAKKVTKEKEEAKARVSMSDIVTNQPQPQPKPKKSMPKEEIVISEAETLEESFAKTKDEKPKMNQVSIKKAEKFFRGARRARKDLEIEKIGGGAKKYFILFAGLFVLLSGLAAAYFFLPKTTLALQVKNQEKSVSLDLAAGVQNQAVNSEDKTLPANLEQVTKEITNEFDSTGSKDGGAKATGQVVIYNEFSSEDQPLVATTRLETEDGKIFRILKNVVVPGAVKVGDETKPGAIEVDVAADQPGESYNIGPADLRIVGFKDTPEKFKKIYAKSAKGMSGGSAGGVKVVTAQDLASAKEKIALLGKRAAAEELKNSSPGQKIFEDTFEVEVLSVSFPEKVGSEKEKFSATAKIRASALSFAESDVKKILRDNLAESGEEAGEISFEKPINYILSDSNLEQKTLKFQAKTDAKTAAGLDLSNFKKGILGKNVEDAKNYAKNFPSIQKMEISFWPFFISRIPMNEARVVVEVK